MGAIQLGLLAREPQKRAEPSSTHFPVDDIDSSIFTPRHPGSSPIKLPASALAIIASYIPAEALGFYVTATALLGYPRGSSDALVAICSLILVALLVLLGYTRNPASKPSRLKLGLAFSFALFAACVYISALPQSFVHEWPPYTSKVSAVVLLGSSIILPILGDLLQFSPSMRER